MKNSKISQSINKSSVLSSKILIKKSKENMNKKSNILTLNHSNPRKSQLNIKIYLPSHQKRYHVKFKK